jgi:predicted nucleic acid-binding protein
VRFTLDTNILVYALDRDAGERHRTALDIARRARGRDCVLTLQALAELFRVLTGPRLRMAPALATDVVQQWRDALPVVAADDACLTEAMDAVTHHGSSFWDAMMWATAKRHGCRVLISEDGQASRTLGGVTIINPFSVAPDPLLAAVLGQGRLESE